MKQIKKYNKNYFKGRLRRKEAIALFRMEKIDENFKML